MKNIIIILITITSLLLSQEYEDVVYLKNGSVIRGVIVEQVPNESIKIKSGKNLFVYQTSEIEKMTKEEIVDAPSSINDNTWSVQIGLGNHRSYSLFSMSKDIKLSNNMGVYISAGIGTPIIGAGFYYQSDFNENGLTFSGIVGYGADAQTWEVMNSTIGYQMRVGSLGFLTFGLAGGYYRPEKLYYSSYHEQWIRSYTEQFYILPVISYDIRF